MHDTTDVTVETTTIADRPAEAGRAGWRAVPRRWGRLLCALTFVVFVLIEVAGGTWPVVLLTPYTPQWTAVALVGVLLLCLPSADKAAALRTSVFRLAGSAALVWGVLITRGLLPWHTVPPAAQVAATDADLGRVKVFAANVHTSNVDHKTLLAAIAEEDPDVIILPEVDDAWMRALRPLNEKYPVRTAMPDSLGNFGMAFYSRLPGTADWFTEVAPGQDDAYAVPQIDAKLQLTDASGVTREIRFFGLHPLPPIKRGNTLARDAVLKKVGSLTAVPTHSIIAGDFNATPYCDVMQKMPLANRHSGTLHDATAPLRFSWPNTWSRWFMGIRIDHVLVSSHWRVVDVHTGRDIGSDHLPIVATLQLVRESR